MKKIVLLFVLCCFIIGCNIGTSIDKMRVTKITPTVSKNYCLYEANSITFTSKTPVIFYDYCDKYYMGNVVMMKSEKGDIINEVSLYFAFLTIAIILMVI